MKQEHDLEVAEAQLAALPVLTELKGKQFDEVMTLLHNPGFGHLVGLLLGERQAHMQVLSRMNLADEDRRWQSAVLQGKIQALARPAETLLELIRNMAPTDEGANP